MDLEKYTYLKILILFWLAFLVLSYFFSQCIFLPEKNYYTRGELSYDQALSKIASTLGADHSHSYQKYKIWDYLNKNILINTDNKMIYGFMLPEGYFIQASNKNFIPDFYGYLFNCIIQTGEPKKYLEKMNVGYFIYHKSSYPACQEKPDQYLICRTVNKFNDFAKDNLVVIKEERDYILYGMKN